VALEQFADFAVEIMEAGFLCPPPGDEDEIVSACDSFAFSDKHFADETADVIALVGLSGFPGSNDGIAPLGLPGLWQDCEHEVAPGFGLSLLANGLKIVPLVEGELAGKFHHKKTGAK
jgi:hypothetical protein